MRRVTWPARTIGERRFIPARRMTSRASFWRMFHRVSNPLVAAAFAVPCRAVQEWEPEHAAQAHDLKGHFVAQFYKMVEPLLKKGIVRFEFKSFDGG